MEKSPYSGTTSFSANQEISRQFFETKYSLPHSQAPTSSLYLQLGQSRPYFFHITYFSIKVTLLSKGRTYNKTVAEILRIFILFDIYYFILFYNIIV